MNFRTDLAIEDISSYNEKEFDGYNLSKIIIDNSNYKKFNKNIGTYYTIDTFCFKEENYNVIDRVSNCVSSILLELFNELNISHDDEIFVVGLGNDNITPDALGPMVIDKVIVTKHLKTYFTLDENFGVVSALKPGVMGETGIETSDIIKSVVKSIKPKCLIVVDALASRSIKRVGASIQISTGGISPGSGVKNKRKEISINTIGIPVIAIGVPTVIDFKNISNDIFNYLDLINNNDLDEEFDYMLTLKEIDRYIVLLSDVLAESINNSIHNINSTN